MGTEITRVVQGSDNEISYYTNDAMGVRLHRQLEQGVDLGDGALRDLIVTYYPPLELATEMLEIGGTIIRNGIATVEVTGIGNFNLGASQGIL